MMQDENENNKEGEQPSPTSVPPPGWQELMDPDGDGAVRIFATPKPLESDMQWLTPNMVPHSQGSTIMQQPMATAAPPQQAESIGTTEDIVRSVPQFGVTAVSSLFGFPGDIIKGGRWLASKAGLPTAETPVLGSAEIEKGIEEFTGPLHKPETFAGKTIDLMAALLPATFGGPEAISVKLATRVAVPAVVAEGAGEAVEEAGLPELRPWAELTGLIVSPFAISKGVEPIAAAIQRGKLVPDTGELKKLRDAQYKIADLMNVQVDRQHFSSWFQQKVGQIQPNVPDLWKVNPKAASVLKLMNDSLAQNQPLTLRQMQGWRKMLGKALGKDDAFGISGDLYGDLNNYIRGLTPNELVGKNAQYAIDAFKKGDELHMRYENSKVLDTIYKRAKNRLANYKEAGEATGLMQKFRQLADKLADTKSPEYRFFTPEMREAIEKVAQGTATVRTLRAIGSFVPWGLKGAAAYGGPAATAAFLGFGKLIAAVAPAAAIVPILAKMGQHALVKHYANQAADLIRLGKPLPKGKTPTYPAALPPLAGQQLLNEENSGQGH